MEQDAEEREYLSNDSHASHPGGVAVKPLVLLRRVTPWPLLWLASLAASIVLTIFVHLAFVIALILLINKGRSYWGRLSEHMRFGCTNPAIVLSRSPMLIAIYTDLRKSDEVYYPTIKVMRTRLSSIAGQPPEAGTRLVTISVYANANPLDDRWSDFWPIPVDHVTDDPQVHTRLVEDLGSEEWGALDDLLADLPTPAKPGLYVQRVADDESVQ